MSYPNEQVEEGLGVFVRNTLPIIHHQYWDLPWGRGCPDLNTRILFHLNFTYGDQLINFFDTHWSYAKECQLE